MFSESSVRTFLNVLSLTAVSQLSLLTVFRSKDFIPDIKLHSSSLPPVTSLRGNSPIGWIHLINQIVLMLIYPFVTLTVNKLLHYNSCYCIFLWSLDFWWGNCDETYSLKQRWSRTVWSEPVILIFGLFSKKMMHWLCNPLEKDNINCINLTPTYPLVTCCLTILASVMDVTE